MPLLNLLVIECRIAKTIAQCHKPLHRVFDQVGNEQWISGLLISRD